MREIKMVRGTALGSGGVFAGGVILLALVAVILGGAGEPAARTVEEESEPRETALTVYNSDLGLVKDVRPRELPRGESDISFADVAARIDPTSVHLRSLAGDEAFRVLEQNFRFDLANPEAILRRYLERGVEVVDGQGELYRGILLSHDPSHLVLAGGESVGSVSILRREELLRINLPKLPEALVTRPTLVWRVEAARGGEQELELEYLTSGINWHAEYVAVVAPASDHLILSAWVSIDNRSGAAYPDARVKLVAGEVHRVRPTPPRGARGDMRMAPEVEPLVEERAFFEYHLYTLARRTTVLDKEIKQVTLFEPTEARARRVYQYDGSRWPNDVRVILEVKNSRAEGLGLPLPQGKVRVYQEDEDGSLEFVGEDLIDHTPRDEEVELYVGNAFDISAERVRVDSRRVTDRVWEETVEVKIRNHKEEAVTVTVVERFWRFWEMLESTHDYRQKDDRTVEFAVPAPVDEEVVLRYRVRYER